MAAPVGTKDYTDGRPPWDWQTKYPPEARSAINWEARILCSGLIIVLVLAGLAIFLSDHNIRIPILAASPEDGVDCRIMSIFFSGCVGGATFSIKWLIHAVAHGSWHLDRRYWRLFVPLIGGVYAWVVLTIFETGIMGGGQATVMARPAASTAAFAFLIGYFSDGVSGLLSNIANAVFGTIKEK